MLQILQDRVMKIIFKYDLYTNITYMLNTLEWLTSEQYLQFQTVVFIYKT